MCDHQLSSCRNSMTIVIAASTVMARSHRHDSMRSPVSKGGPAQTVTTRTQQRQHRPDGVNGCARGCMLDPRVPVRQRQGRIRASSALAAARSIVAQVAARIRCLQTTHVVKYCSHRSHSIFPRPSWQWNWGQNVAKPQNLKCWLRPVVKGPAPIAPTAAIHPVVFSVRRNARPSQVEENTDVLS